ncbi:MAG: RNA polymerase sigma factor [Gemmatimonadaceae bacterium]
MERSENTAWSEDDGSVLASTRYPTSARLLAAIHRGEEPAIRELFLLYAPLLRDQARRMGVEPDERDEVVTTLLDDVVLHLMRNELAPRHLARYLVASLRNRARKRYRDLARHRATHDSAYMQLGSADERIVAECHSEYGLRASFPMDPRRSLLLNSAIAKLAEKSANELTRDEMVMIVGLGRHLPLRDLAEQLGITYVAARVRLHRLRERFRKLAIQYIVTLKPDEKREIERFFRRAEVHLSEKAGAKTDLRAKERAQPGTKEGGNDEDP